MRSAAPLLLAAVLLSAPASALVQPPLLADCHALVTGPAGCERWSAAWAPTDESVWQTWTGVSPSGATVYAGGFRNHGCCEWDVWLRALDAADGSLLWHADFDGSGHGTDADASFALSADGTRIFVAGSSYVFGGGVTPSLFGWFAAAYDASSGAEAWRHEASAPYGSSIVALDAQAGLLYVAAGVAWGTVDTSLVALRAEDGSTAGAWPWEGRVVDLASRRAFGARHEMTGTIDIVVDAVTFPEGDPLWTRGIDTGLDDLARSIIPAGDRLILVAQRGTYDGEWGMGGADGYLVTLDAVGGDERSTVAYDGVEGLVDPTRDPAGSVNDLPGASRLLADGALALQSRNDAGLTTLVIEPDGRLRWSSLHRGTFSVALLERPSSLVSVVWSSGSTFEPARLVLRELDPATGSLLWTGATDLARGALYGGSVSLSPDAAVAYVGGVTVGEHVGARAAAIPLGARPLAPR